MNVVAVVGLRWISRGARAGAPSITLWILAALTFFVPLAAALIELSSRYPQQGGIYVWARRAFGPFHGFLCGWCLWVNNLFYFPSLLLFAAANALTLFGHRFDTLAESHLYSVLFVTLVLWLLTALNIVGFRAGKWLQNAGAVSTWIPAALLVGAGLVALTRFGSATSFSAHELVPRGEFLSTVSLWSAMCFAFSGFEVTSMVGQEVKNPTRTIPLGVIIAGAMTAAIYVAGSVSVLMAVPASALSERSGIADAVDLVSRRVGLAGVGAVTGGLLTLGAIAGTSSWFAGAARVPFAAGLDSVLPHALARLHPRYRTPHVSLVAQAATATAILFASLFFTMTQRRGSVQEAYDIMVNLTILIYFVPYLYLFLALVRLRRLDGVHDRAEGFHVPGGSIGLWTVACSGFAATAVSLLLVLVPPPGTENVMNFEMNLFLQAAAVVGIGLGFYWYSVRTADLT